MKIAGVAGAKHPTLKRGDAIPLSPEDKVEGAAREEFVKSSPEGYKYLPTKAVVVGDVQVVKGREVRKNPDPDQYIGTVEITYRKLRLGDDRLFPGETVKVKVHCRDSKDELGVDDLETMSFEILS